MRLLSLLVLFFAGSISLFAATSESAVTLSPPASAAPVFKNDSLSLNPAGKVKPLFVWPQDGRFTRRPTETTTCYKIRAYYMVRERRNSDVTRPDGYSTCQPASRFQVKRAIGHRMIQERTTKTGSNRAY